MKKAITPLPLAATKFLRMGNQRGRGIREGNKRSKYTNMIKKQRRVGEPEPVDQREQLAVFGNLLDPSLPLTQHFALDLVDDKSRA